MSELNTQFDASVSLQEIVVTSTAELNAALNTMQSTGGVIKLASGLDTYQIELINMGGAGRPITIEPVDLNDPPVVSDILISNSEYITLNGLIVEARDDEIGLNGGDAGNVDIYGSSFITLSNSVISGNAGGMWTVENGPAVTGGRAVDSDNITITGTTFENLGHGFRFSNVTNFYFTENELTGLQGDGLGGSGLQDATISGNYMHDFWGSTQDVNHSDMIQIFGSTTAIPTQNVIIENNIFDSGNGAATETIFIRNEQFGLSDSENATFHENIQINNNVIHNGHGHGIAVNDVDGLQIHQNTVLWNQASGMVSNLGGDSVSAVPSIKAGNSVNVSMQENVSFRTTVEGVEQSGNYAITYTDAGAENYAYSHFVNLSGMGDTDFRDLMLRAESTLSGEFGASLTTNINPYLPDMGNLAVLSYDNKPGDNLGFQFSADYSVIKGADIEETNVTVTWLFSDGHVAEGLHAVHTFESAGQYQVQLMLRDANGEELYLTREIDVNQYEHLKLDFSENIIDTSGYNSEFTVEGEGYTSGRDGEGAFHVNESNSISFSQVNTHLENFETLQINVGVKLDTVGEAGYILHHHKAYRLFAYDDGSLFFSIETNEGYFELRTDAAVIADNDWHDISIQYDGPANSLKLLVDSAEVASGEASGITNFDPSYTLVIGHPWGDAASVTIDELEIMSPKSIVAKNIEDTSQPVIQGTTDDVLNPIFLEEAESTQQPSVSPAVVPADEEASVSDVNVSVTLDFDNGVKDISTNASELIVVGNGSAEGRDGNAAFHIDDDSSIRFSLTNEHLSNLDTLQINVGVKLDDVGTEGYILHHHKAYRLFAYDDGSLFFSIETNEGYFELRTDAAVIADNDWHDISIQYDGPANSLRLLVDSAEVASGEASGTTNFDPSHGLIVGHPWGSAASATIDTLEISSPPATENLTGSYLYSFFDIDPEQLVNTMEIETNYTNEALEVDDYINTPGDWDFMS